MEQDLFIKGLCPYCGEVVEKRGNGSVGTCGDGKDYNLHVAHVLFLEAVFQGTEAIKEKLIEGLSKNFFEESFGIWFNKGALLGHIKIVDIEESPVLFGIALKEGVKVTKKLIAEKKREIKTKYGIEISPADAAAIIAFAHLKRGCRDGDFTRDIALQDRSDLEINENGEFVLLYSAFGPVVEILVEDESCIIIGDPDIGIRFEKKECGMRVYIKPEQYPAVVIYNSLNCPLNSGIYIITNTGK